MSKMTVLGLFLSVIILVAFSGCDAIQMYEAACQKNRVAACNKLGSMYEHGKGAPQDDRLARQYYELACAEGRVSNRSREACVHLSRFYGEGRGGLFRDPSRANKLFEDVCGTVRPRREKRKYCDWNAKEQWSLRSTINLDDF